MAQLDRPEHVNGRRLFGTDRQGMTPRFVALIDSCRVIRADSLKDLALHLRVLGIGEQDVRLASPDDGDHALSLSQHAEFRAAWLVASAADGV